MCGKKGFTLIELLVVIAIIALLMSILLPSLSRVRNQAKSVMCLMNLKQWTNLYALYQTDNHGSFHPEHHSGNEWMSALRGYYDNSGDIRCCPTAMKPHSEGGKNPFAAWGIYASGNPQVTEGDYGSYGANMWLENYDEVDVSADPGAYEYFGRGLYWKTVDNCGKYASQIPMILDAASAGGIPDARPGSGVAWPMTPPEFDGDTSGGMGTFVMNRHNGNLNSSFVDGSVRKVGIKELWKLKWHKQFRTNYWYDFYADIGWPDWMKDFKDY